MVEEPSKAKIERAARAVYEKANPQGLPWDQLQSQAKIHFLELATTALQAAARVSGGGAPKAKGSKGASGTAKLRGGMKRRGGGD